MTSELSAKSKDLKSLFVSAKHSMYHHLTGPSLQNEDISDDVEEAWLTSHMTEHVDQSRRLTVMTSSADHDSQPTASSQCSSREAEAGLVPPSSAGSRCCYTGTLQNHIQKSISNEEQQPFCDPLIQDNPGEPVLSQRTDLLE